MTIEATLAHPAPRAIPDARPAADAAATARIAAPPGAAPPVPPPGSARPDSLAVAPVSPAQAGLVAQGLLDPRPVLPVRPADLGRDAPFGERPEPPRLLKPFDVPILPAARPLAEDRADGG